MNPYAEYENVIPLIAPVDTAATAIQTPFVDLKTAHRLAVAVYFGVITTTSADQPGPTVTVVCSTAATTVSETEIAFNYRLSTATGANSFGAVTAATSAGVATTNADDGKMMWIEVDPAVVQAKGTDKRFVSVFVTPDAGATVTLVGAVGFVQPRYKGATMISTT